MQNSMIALGVTLLSAAAACVQAADWPPEKQNESTFTERKLEVFQHGIKQKLGYAAPQRDTFLVLHPKQSPSNAPLYVVLHSAGHDVHSCLACTTRVGNHDIYHAPPDFFALYLDCRANKGDWWWGHDTFYMAMNERKYPLFMYWGPFGHANNHANILKVNDLINSFDWLSVKKNEAYPVFTNASTNDPLPWPDRLDDQKPGQVNAFFRWKRVRETRDEIEMTLFLITPSELKTMFRIPTEATADVSLRRLQMLQIGPGATVHWTFGSAGGDVQADATGCVTILGLKITADPAALVVRSVK